MEDAVRQPTYCKSRMLICGTFSIRSTGFAVFGGGNAFGWCSFLCVQCTFPSGRRANLHLFSQSLSDGRKVWLRVWRISNPADLLSISVERPAVTAGPH